MFRHEEFWINSLIILLVVYILGKSMHLIGEIIWKKLLFDDSKIKITMKPEKIQKELPGKVKDGI